MNPLPSSVGNVLIYSIGCDSAAKVVLDDEKSYRDVTDFPVCVNYAVLQLASEIRIRRFNRLASLVNDNGNIVRMNKSSSIIPEDMVYPPTSLLSFEKSYKNNR